jgi:hypothetical protein
MLLSTPSPQSRKWGRWGFLLPTTALKKIISAQNRASLGGVLDSTESSAQWGKFYEPPNLINKAAGRI